MLLNILICTVVDRRHLFLPLLAEFEKQIKENNLSSLVKVIYAEDNKEISVGLKRQRLLESSTAKYIVYFDSDDFPSPNYVKDIVTALKTSIIKSSYINGVYHTYKHEPDCVGFLIKMTTDNSNEQVCCHSLQYPIWESGVDGYDYVRNVTHFNPVKRSIAIQAGFQDKRFGEDKEYSDKITKLCEHEIFINDFLFHYRFSTAQSSEEKYGFNKDK